MSALDNLHPVQFSAIPSQQTPEQAESKARRLARMGAVHGNGTTTLTAPSGLPGNQAPTD